MPGVKAKLAMFEAPSYVGAPSASARLGSVSDVTCTSEAESDAETFSLKRKLSLSGAVWYLNDASTTCGETASDVVITNSGGVGCGGIDVGPSRVANEAVLETIRSASVTTPSLRYS